MQMINCELFANQLKNEVKEKLQAEKFKSIPRPHLVMIQVGDNLDSEIYIKNIKNACEEVGINFSHYSYKEEIPEDKLISIVERLSLNPTVTGISIQLPLPSHINTQKVIESIDPIKDVDGVTPVQAGFLQLGLQNENRLLPCKAKGIVRLLEHVTYLKGKKVAVLGRNNTIGIPVAQLLQEKNATVISCNGSTSNLEEYTNNCDITILNMGLPGFFTNNYFYTSKDKIIIDTGINKDGKSYGYLNKEFISSNNQDLYTRSWRYTPVPKGVDIMAVSELLDNIYIAYENQFDYIWDYCKTLQIAEARLNNFKEN